MSFDQTVLRRLREGQARKLTQSDVAEVLGITGGAYAKKETGTVAITVTDLTKLAEFYNIPLSHFFEDEGGEDDTTDTKEMTDQILKLTKLVAKLSLELSEKNDLIDELRKELGGYRNPQ